MSDWSVHEGHFDRVHHGLVDLGLFGAREQIRCGQGSSFDRIRIGLLY